MCLSKMFELQKDLNEKIIDGLHTKDLSDEERVEWIQKFITAMQQETAELRDSLQWKWWAKKENDFDNAKVECIDILCFLNSILILLGMTPKDVFELYEKKCNLNHERQNKGYKNGEYNKFENGLEDNKLLLSK